VRAGLKVPPQAIGLALAASIYPPAVAAIIAIGRGAQVRTRVLVFVLAAAGITYASGVLMLFALSGLGATGPLHYTPSASLELALGVVLIAFALHLRRRPRKPPSESSTKLERRLQSHRLAFALGLTLYVLPSPIYVAAVKSVADADFSTGHALLALAITVAVMLWLVELPMLALVVVPARAASVLERVNLWFARRGRLLVVLLCAGAGVYLSVKGLLALLS
jgi:Sap, sulfolipid-1-addressing protein